MYNGIEKSTERKKRKKYGEEVVHIVNYTKKNHKSTQSK